MTDITENDLDEEDAGPKPRVTDTPIEIWLQYGDELLVDTPHSTLARDGEVSWCDSQVFPFDVKYVRSDEVDRLRARVAELEAADGICFTAMLVEIDGHAYGLRPGAARVVREALLDARRYKWLRDTPGVSWDELTDGGVSMWVGDASAIRAPSLDAAIDAAMAKDGA